MTTPNKKSFLFLRRLCPPPAVAISIVLATAGCGSDDATSPDPSLHDEAGGWQQVVAGDGATCGLDRSGVAYCWGKNDVGQLGDGTTTPHPAPALVHGGLRFSTLSMGPLTACGLSQAGETYCWGYYGVVLYTEPHLVETPLRFTALAVGNYSLCTLTAEGVGYCWSLIRTDQMPVLLSTSQRFKKLAVASTWFTGAYCGVGTEGAGYCWGEGFNIESEAGGIVRQPLPPAVDQIVTVGEHTCAVLSLFQRITECWGENSSGELGDGSTADRSAPVAVAGGLQFASIGLTSQRTCGVSVRGGGYCWGVLQGITTISNPVLTPAIVLPGLRVDRVSVGPDHTCFMTPGGAAYCFGFNGAGQLGTGMTGDPVEGPVRVLDPT